MKETSNRTTLGTVAYGLVIIVPAAIVFLLLVKLTEILEKVAAPLGLESSFGAASAMEVADCLSQWGIGSKKLVDSMAGAPGKIADS